MHVTVTDNPVAPVAGRFLVADLALFFHPRFHFDAGRSYTVRFDPARLPTPRAGATVEVRLRTATSSTSLTPTSVVGIYPSATVWPENMLRFYIHFSGPMSRGAGTKYVHLVDDTGREVPDAMLAAYADLWNPEATRLTVFFDPGRVKRGVGPNVAMGRAIVSGRKYAITIDQAWHDEAGRPLIEGFRRAFTAGPAAYAALSTSDWRVTPPAAGSRGAVSVTFPAPLDRALLERAIGVRFSTAFTSSTPSKAARDVGGRVAIETGETTWNFLPAGEWKAGPYELAILTLLEDPAGNKIGRAFEVLPTDAQPAPEVETVRVKFAIK